MNQEERLKKLQNELAGKKIINEEPSFSARLTYGNNKELDKLVDSKLVMDRLKAVEVNYGIKKLVCDSDYRVRLAIARKGYFFESFIRDSSPLVRLEFAKHFPARVCDDINPIVRDCAKKIMDSQI